MMTPTRRPLMGAAYVSPSPTFRLLSADSIRAYVLSFWLGLHPTLVRKFAAGIRGNGGS